MSNYYLIKASAIWIALVQEEKMSVFEAWQRKAREIFGAEEAVI